MMKLHKTLNRTFALGAGILLALTAAACSSGSDAEPGEPGEPGEPSDMSVGTQESYETLPFKDVLPLAADVLDGHEKVTIGFSNTCYNVPWRVAMLESLKAEAERHANLELVAVDGQCDAAKQRDSVQDLLTRGVDVVIMSPMESQALSPAATMVREAGIPIITLDRDVYSEKDLFIGQNNISTSKKLGEQLVKDLGGEGNVLNVTGASGSSAQVDRQAGMKAALDEAPGIEIVAEGDGQWLADSSRQLVADWLVRFDPEDIDAIWTDSEDEAWGAVPAIAAAGACDAGIKIYTIDGSRPALMDVKAGTFTGVGAYSPRIGDVAVRAAIKLVLGEEIEGAKEYDLPGLWLELPDLPIATADNVDDLLPTSWGDFDAPADPCR